jgi:prevent-host-death family protein
MITETSAVAFRQNLGEMLNQVQYRRDSIVINKDGRPVAVLIDAALFERIRRMQARFDELAERFSRSFADVPAEQGLAEIAGAVSRARAQAAKRTAARRKKA